MRTCHEDGYPSGRTRLFPVCFWVLVTLVAASLSCNLPMQAKTTTDTPTSESINPPAVFTPFLEATLSPSPLPPTETAVDTPTATITATATLGIPLFTATTNANCRSGPGMNYDILRVLPAGTSEPIVGKDSTGTWWVIQNGIRCWINYTTGTASGDLSRVSILPAPPTPTWIPTATQTMTPTPTITPTPTTRIFMPTSIVRTIIIPPLVSSASVTVDPVLCSPCPCWVYWHGTITTTGALTAQYQWEAKYNDSPWDAPSTGALVFSGAGTKSTFDWGAKAPAGTVITARLHVTSPNEVYSNEVTVTYCP